MSSDKVNELLEEGLGTIEKQLILLDQQNGVLDFQSSSLKMLQFSSNSN